MSVVTEHLEQQGSAFEVLPHRQTYTSADEARALGIDADEVLKPLAMRTGSGYALMVIPPGELFGGGRATTAPLRTRPGRAGDDPIA